MFLKKFKKNTETLISDRKLNELIHFLRTPVSSIKAGSQILKGLLPELIEVYEKSLALQVVERKIDEVKLKKLTCVLSNILSEAERISEYVNDVEQRKT